jgi:hypothetical protein
MNEIEALFFEDVAERTLIMNGIRESKRRRRERLRRPIFPFEHIPISQRPAYVKAGEVTEFEIERGDYL